MILSVQRIDLLSKLTALIPVIPNHNAKPITECIKLNLTDDVLEITASDLTITMSSKISVNGVENGLVVVPGKKFFTIIKEMPETKISFKLENNVLKITSGKIKFELSITENPESFPESPESKNENFIELDSVKLKNYISKTSFAVTTDELRPVLTGVLFSLKYNELIMVATDSVMLVKISDKNIKYEAEDRDIIFPSKTLNVIAGSIDKNDICKIYFEDKFVIYQFEDTTIYSRLINGKYPAYNAIIPVNNSLKINVDKSVILSSLKRISISCNALTRLISSKFINNKLIISSEDSNTLSSAEEEITISYDAEEITLGFNITKLSNLIRNINSTSVEFNIEAPNKPVIIKPYENDESYDLLTLIMPVKVSK